MNLLGVFHWEKTKKYIFEQPNTQKLKKLKTKQKSFSGLRQFSIFFHENFWDWSLDEYDWLMQRALMWLNLYDCEAVRHTLKNRQKCIFGVFRLFLGLCRTASQLYRLSHINVLDINQCYTSKDQSQKFSRKILRIGEALKMIFV